MTKLILFASLFILFFTGHSFARSEDPLLKKIQEILSDKNATVGVSIIGNDGKDTVSVNDDKRYPMQSVFKYHIALAVLSEVDKGKFSADRQVKIDKKDLLPGLWSPLREENPEGGNFTISKLIQYAVSQSDNVSCDALLRLIGGPQSVEDYFRQININDISVKLNEEKMQANRELMFQNWITPKAANETLARFYSNSEKLLSEKSHGFIWSVMKETETGANRLKGQLPEGTVVAHKTGSSGTSNEGITEAVNDIGIVFLSDGKHFFISVFVTDSREDDSANEKIIAEIAKAAWDHFSALPR